MIYKNIEIHNVAELYDCPEGGVSFLRVPKSVYDCLEHGTQARNMAKASTGVELRFVIKSGEGAVIRMSKLVPGDGTNVFHVYYGGIQGGWEECEINKYVFDSPRDFFIKRPKNLETLRKMAKENGDPWDPEVVRVIFDRGAYRFTDVVGDVAPPQQSQCPDETVLFYGSSITSGSNSIDMSHSWPAVVGHNLKMDVRNLGLAGSCAMEKETIDFIADMGKRGLWNVCVLELGINVVKWAKEKIYERATYAISAVANGNPDKKIFVISPFYSDGDFYGRTDAEQWRRILSDIVENGNFDNVVYINGLELLGDSSGLSADEIHPNIYGIQRIAERLTRKMQDVIGTK